MTIESGLMLAHYRLVEKIGEGGMGVVWLAEDTKLERQVAIKILPDQLARDPDRLARFEREARVLASLNHPGIAAIYGLEQAGDVRFLVLELVPGETLAEKIERGPIPLGEALDIGRQIAEAVETAHENGILHRDLKPANVKVTPDDKVKVLDFGLAKTVASEQGSSDTDHSPTITSAGTMAGVILGTAAYMSPEQARGKRLDKRTDTWSFGCVMYEALTGRRPFGGETLSDTVARILEREPEWSELERRAPRKIVRLLRRCMNKDAFRRLRDIGDARIEIEEQLSGTVDETVAPATPQGRRKPWLFPLQAAGFALVGALAVWVLTSGTPAGPSGLEVVEVARLTHDPGLSEWPTWSPDGSMLAFAADRDGDFEIYIRRVDGGQVVNVTQNPGQDFQPAFSPDGESLAFVSTRSSRTGMIKIGSTWGLEFRTLGGDLWSVPALGGQARRLAPDANFPAFSPDGSRIAFVSGKENHRSILEVPSEGGEPRELLPASSSTWEIVRLNYSPNGKWLSFETLQGDVYLALADGSGEPKELTTATSHVWDGSGQRLFYLVRESSGGTRLLSVAVDESSGTVVGEPEAFGLMTGYLRDLAVSRDGRSVAASELEGSLNLTLLPLTAEGDAAAGPEQVLSSGQVIDRYPMFSPDGRHIAFSSDRLGPQEIWVLDRETGEQRQLELPGEDQGVNLSYWSPDGKKLNVTRSVGDGLQSIWLAASDGSDAEQLIEPTPRLQGGPFSPDGRSLLYSTRSGEYAQTFVLDLDTKESRQLTSSSWDSMGGEWAPDGKSIVLATNQSGSIQAWRIPVEGGESVQLTTGDERVRHAFHSADPRWLYFQPSHRNIYRMPSGGGPARAITDFPESGLFLEEPAVSRDGRFLTYCRSNGGSSLWLLSLADRSE